MHYHIVSNVPGYMPDSEPYRVETKGEAISALVEEKRWLIDGGCKVYGNARDLYYYVTEDGRVIEAVECWECN